MRGVAKYLLRPLRDRYEIEELGPADFILCGKVYTREDFALWNARGLKLQCSWFKQKFLGKPGPCVVYCHGSCGSRKECLELLTQLLPAGYTVFSMDFTGSGLSEGQYVSLGYHEKNDVKVVVEHLHRDSQVSQVVLWGRSMGAVSALLYSATDPKLALIILDSPFVSLQLLLEDLLLKTIILRPLCSSILNSLSKRIRELAQFPVEELDTLKCLQLCRSPAIFIHGKTDKLVPVAHTRKLFSLYPGDRYLLETGGGHNTSRPASVLTEVLNILAGIIT